MARADQARAKIRSHISGNVEAAKEFLVVAIGLGLTNAITEKLKVGFERGQSNVEFTGGSAPPTIDPFFHFQSFILLVFGIYAVRFFFNNYIYLHQSYDEHRLDELDAEGRDLRPLILSSALDLGLSIFTGIMMSIISMTLSDGGIRLQYLIIFLVIHYLIDAFVLGRNIFTRRREPGYEREQRKVLFWLISNIVFTMIFLGVLFLDETDTAKYPENLLFQVMMWIWLVNSVINLAITYVYRDRTLWVLV